MELKIGGIYRLDRTRFYSGHGDKEMLIFTERVLFYDQFEVFTDIIYKSESDWSLNKKHKTRLWFGKSSMRPFDEDAMEIGFAEFSNELRQYYRTDLLMRISRIKSVSWNDNMFSQMGMLKEYIAINTSEEWQNQRLACPSVYLIPSGNSGGFKSPILVEADNKEFFTSTEILWKASQLQRKHFTATSLGAGVFRSGTKNGIPVFYLEDYFGGGDYLKEFEESGVGTNV